MSSNLPDWLSQSDFPYNATEIQQELERKKQTPTNPAIRLLLVIGVFLGSIFLFGALFMMGFQESMIGVLMIGIASVAGGLMVNRKSRSEVYDTIAVSVILMGCACLAEVVAEWLVDTPLGIPVMALVALVIVVLSYGFVLPFLGTIGFFTALFLWFAMEEFPLGMSVLYTILCVGITLMYLGEAEILAKLRPRARLFDPVRLGSLISVIIGLLFFTPSYFPDFLTRSQLPYFVFYFSVPTTLLCLYTIYYLTPSLGVRSSTAQWGVLLLFIVILSFFLYAPAVSLTLLLLFLTFYGRHPTGIVLSFLSLCIAVTYYYYELHYTLLTKSVILMLTGLLFLMGYWFINRHLHHHEENS